jgi:hypothetical protein
LKSLLKKYYQIWNLKSRISAQVQISQQSLFQQYRSAFKTDKQISFKDSGYRVFSQFEEDGKLLYLFSHIGMDASTFVEIGSDDGINSNSANLAFNFGWHGLFIDGNKKAIDRGRSIYSNYPHKWDYPPVFTNAFVKKDNVNDLITSANLKGDIGLLSIDIDGNDFWIWDAINTVTPRVVIIESQVIFGDKDLVVPYDENYYYSASNPYYHGASPQAMVNLAKKKGYRLVGSNKLGFNLFFVREEYISDKLPEVSVQSVLTHPSVKDGLNHFDKIKENKFLKSEDIL